MDQRAPTEMYLPYRFFTAEEWAGFRADAPLTPVAERAAAALGQAARETMGAAKDA